jgi:hypothetical protein
VGANVTATFDVAMDPTTINTTNVTLRNPANALIAAVVTYNATTRTVTLNPNANLAQGTVYTVTLSGLKSAAGGTLPTTTWSFTTNAPVNNPPTVTVQNPLPGSVGVARGTNVTARFSEAITGGNTSTFVLTNTATGAVVPAVVTQPAAARLLLNPNAALARNTNYTVTLTGGPAAIRDLLGLGLSPSTVTWSFTTAP